MPKPTLTAAMPEHEIHFAQPTSLLADRLNLPRGGWILSQSGDRHASFDSYSDAKFFASKLPSMPSRWSVDNPLNSQFEPAQAA